MGKSRSEVEDGASVFMNGTFTCAMCGVVHGRDWSDAESIMADATVFPDAEAAPPTSENIICEICFRRVKGLTVEEYERLYGCKALLGEEEARV